MDKYVRRASRMLNLSFLVGWEEELAEMNYKKRGRPFELPDSFISFIQRIRCLGAISSRIMEGFILSLQEIIPDLRSIDHSTVCERANRLKPDVFASVKKRGPTSVAIDSAGLHIGRQGAWMEKKHKESKKKKRKLYLKLHWAVDVRTGKVVELFVTKPSVHDTKKAEALVDGAQERVDMVKFLADGAYDNHRNFAMCAARRMIPAIKLRKNAKARTESERSRWVSICSASGLGRQGWFEKVGYGARWGVETAFSVFKTSFGENLLARNPENCETEVRFKTWMYNEFLTG